jgi:hypothetical protein
MTASPPIRWLAAAVVILLITAVLAACAPAGSSVARSPSTPSGATTGDPGPAIDTDTLVADAASRDGQPVRVSGFFLADATTAQLCSMSLESYPPQCGGGTVRLVGEVPADVLATLDSTTEPGLDQATWGWVVVTGTFRASGVDGQPTIEFGEVILAEG